MKQKIFNETYDAKIDTIDTQQELILPMLALKYNDRKHDIKFPCLVQPKLNGVRCTYQNGKFISRKGKEYTTLSHMIPFLEKIKDKVAIPDGEIFCRDMTFQEIASAVKKTNDDSKRLEYWIYDQIADVDFFERHRGITQAFIENNNVDGEEYKSMGPLVMVPTKFAQNEAEIMELHATYTSEGYEGTIIRNTEGKYKPNLKRSSDLQKYKDFHDMEFTIVGGKPATGTEEGCVVFRCQIKLGQEFDVRPKGTREQKREWMKDIDKIIGKQLTVRYQEFSDDGVPIFPVGIAIRDYE